MYLRLVLRMRDRNGRWKIRSFGRLKCSYQHPVLKSYSTSAEIHASKIKIINVSNASREGSRISWRLAFVISHECKPSILLAMILPMQNNILNRVPLF